MLSYSDTCDEAESNKKRERERARAREQRLHVSCERSGSEGHQPHKTYVADCGGDGRVEQRREAQLLQVSPAVIVRIKVTALHVSVTCHMKQIKKHDNNAQISQQEEVLLGSVGSQHTGSALREQAQLALYGGSMLSARTTPQTSLTESVQLNSAVLLGVAKQDVDRQKRKVEARLLASANAAKRAHKRRALHEHLRVAEQP